MITPPGLVNAGQAILNEKIKTLFNATNPDTLGIRFDGWGFMDPTGNGGSRRVMLQAILSGDLGGTLADVQETAHVEDGQYDLNLPAGFVKQDAPPLAWLTSDDATLECALTIGRT